MIEMPNQRHAQAMWINKEEHQGKLRIFENIRKKVWRLRRSVGFQGVPLLGSLIIPVEFLPVIASPQKEVVRTRRFKPGEANFCQFIPETFQSLF